MSPADEFIFAPDPAEPLAGRVTVEGARPAGTDSVYFVDVFVRRMSLLERFLPFTRPDGATVVPAEQLLPAGTSEEERDQQNAEDMQRSEQVAAAVALKALGYDVRAIPRGVLVTGVAGDAPAAGKLETGDVVVEVDGATVKTPDELRAGIGRHSPGEKVDLVVRRGGKRVRADGRDDPEPRCPGSPDRRHPGRPGGGHRASDRRGHRPGPRRRPLGRPSLRARDRAEARARRDWRAAGSRPPERSRSTGR